jgi:S1-C subfamily serine protease
MHLTVRNRFRLAAAAALAALAAGLSFAFVGHASGATRPAKPKLLPTAGIVDVTTNLAYQGGAAAGTGMVLTPTGDVLTNNHVIRGASTVRVIVPSTGKSYPATVIGYSVTSDVALLHLKGATNLRTITVGNVAALKIGQLVTAVGNAGGIGGAPSIVRGKVTALGKTIVASDESGLSEQLTGLIQSSAPIRPGDSGGALLNAVGRVVGMNTAGSTDFFFRSGGGATHAYAIPINRVVTLAKQIRAGRESGAVHVGSTPFLGVSVSTGGSGLLVQSVVPGSPAEQAGLTTGDTITTADGEAVTTYNALTNVMLRHHAGDVVTLEWVSGITGATQSANVQTAVGPPQ